DRRLRRVRRGGHAVREGRPRLDLRRQPGVVRRGPGRARQRGPRPRQGGGRAAAHRPGGHLASAAEGGARARPLAGRRAERARFGEGAAGGPGRGVPGQRRAAGRGADRAAARRDGRAGEHPRRRVPGHPHGGEQVTTRHFLKADDLSPGEQDEVLTLAAEMKKDRFGYRPFEGPQTVAVLFDKPSARTRISFHAGIGELGGLPLIVDGVSTLMGRGEPVEDIARVLGRQVAAIVWRTSAQRLIETMAANAAVPVVNALTDDYHPCQILADLQTVRERLGRTAGLTLAYVGDGA